MTREEQIREASIDYQMSTSPRVIGGDAFADFARKMNVNSSFIAGAKWADQTMIEKACEWLKNNTLTANNDSYTYTASYHDISKEEFVEQFKKAMEGGEE